MRRRILASLAKSGYTAKDYMQDGLIAMWDGIENAGWGVHSSDMVLTDLIGGRSHIDFVNTSRGDYGIVFDGRNDQTGMLNDYGDLTSQVLTSEFCVRLNSTKNQCFMQLSGSGNRHTIIAGVYNSGRELFTGPLQSPIYDITSIKIGTVAVLYEINSDNSIKAFNNAVELIYKRAEGFLTSYGMHSVGNRQSNTSYAMSGELFSIRFYSRQLTNAEVAANYAIDKARFNLPDAT